jgi:hypothetical protein
VPAATPVIVNVPAASVVAEYPPVSVETVAPGIGEPKADDTTVPAIVPVVPGVGVGVAVAPGVAVAAGVGVAVAAVTRAESERDLLEFVVLIESIYVIDNVLPDVA